MKTITTILYAVLAILLSPASRGIDLTFTFNHDLVNTDGFKMYFSATSGGRDISYSFPLNSPDLEVTSLDGTLLDPDPFNPNYEIRCKINWWDRVGKFYAIAIAYSTFDGESDAESYEYYINVRRLQLLRGKDPWNLLPIKEYLAVEDMTEDNRLFYSVKFADQ